jgi:hypothetical protein
MWKSALDEDSEEEEFGTYACGFGRVNEAPVKKSAIDDRLDRALGKVDGRNSLGEIFDKILLGFPPVEEETRNPSHKDSETPSHVNKLAHTKSSSSQKRPGTDGSLSLGRSLSFRKGGSLRSNSSSFSDGVKRRDRVLKTDSRESF